MFWDYRDLPKPVQWAIFIPSILAVIGANAVAIVLSIVTTHLDTDGFTTTTLVAVSSTILHIFQVMSTPPNNRKSEFPHVRKVLLACLFLAVGAHSAFIYYLCHTHDELFATLSKLLCIAHGVFAETITKIWTYVYASKQQKRRIPPPVLYVFMAVQLGYFGVGIWLLFRHNLQVVWCLCGFPLWFLCGIYSSAYHRFRKSRKIFGDQEDGYMMSASIVLACLSGLAALASTILPCIRDVRRWTPLFFVEYAFVEFFTGWGFISPFAKQLSGIVGACLPRKRNSEQSSDLETGRAASIKSARKLDIYSRPQGFEMDTIHKDVEQSLPGWSNKVKSLSSVDMDQDSVNDNEGHVGITDGGKQSDVVPRPWSPSDSTLAVTDIQDKPEKFVHAI